MALLIFTDTIQMWHILFLSFYLGVVFAVDMPARQASLILMVNKNSDLKSAIALHSVIFNLSRLIGPTAAGFIIFITDEAICFAITAVSYIPVIAALFIIKFRARENKVAKKQSIIQDIVEVVKYSKNVYYMRVMFAFFIVVGFFSYSYSVMLPIYAKDVLHGSSQLLGFLQGFFGLGAMTGAFAVAAFITMRKLPNAIFTLVLLHSICMIIFGLSTNHYISLVMMVPAGFGLISSLLATNIYLQSAVRSDMRGRAASLYSIGIYGLGPLGAFFAGIMTEHFSPQITVVVWCSIMIISAIVFGFRLKRVNKELEPVWQEFEKH